MTDNAIHPVLDQMLNTCEFKKYSYVDNLHTKIEKVSTAANHTQFGKQKEIRLKKLFGFMLLDEMYAGKKPLIEDRITLHLPAIRLSRQKAKIWNSIEKQYTIDTREDIQEIYKIMHATREPLNEIRYANKKLEKQKEELFTCEIDKEFALNLYNFASEKNYLIRIDTPYGRYINDKKYFLVNEIELYENPKEFLYQNKILQLTIGMKSKKELEEIIEKLEKNPYIKIENKYSINFKGEQLWLINIINVSSSKGNAIYGLCKYLKINVEEAVAFGDDLNDISMMKTVGMGVAMGNAVLEVKELAKEIIGDNNRPSIAEFINRIINENKKTQQIK